MSLVPLRMLNELAYFSSTQHAVLVEQLTAIIKPTEDRLLLVPLGRPHGPLARTTQAYGQPVPELETLCRVV